MAIRPLQLVTIICETLIEDRLVRDLKRLGVTGYTRSSVRGRDMTRVLRGEGRTGSAGRPDGSGREGAHGRRERAIPHGEMRDRPSELRFDFG